ncbi:O-antigen ligase family protein [Microbacterium sp. NPDC090007]|uniref:O-antigen ligase family protein n=1 Tax=Microbacterium sp. NPDC090007 TaxID=3364204 RepID=UPI00380ECFFA
MVVLLALASLAQPVVEAVTTDRAHYVEGAVTASRPLVAATTAVTNAVIPLVAIVALLSAMLWSRIDAVALSVVALPSIVIVADEFVHDRPLGPALLVPALAGVLVITQRVKFGDLVVVGRIGAIVAAASVIGMVLDPERVLMSAGLAHAEKSITGAPLLAGIFSHSNTFGLFLTASLPLVFLEKGFVVRWALVVPIAWALVLSSSRTALFGACVVLVAILLGRMLPRIAFRVVLPAGLIVAAGFVARIPFGETDPAAYTYRGEIWMYNIDLLQGNALWGRGVYFYADHYAELSRALSTAASHAHNTLLTLLVTGGAVTVAAVLVVLVFSWRGADRLGDRRQLFVAGAFLLGMLVLCATETTLRLTGWGPLSACFVVPLFVLVGEATAVRATSLVDPGGDAFTAARSPWSTADRLD